MVITDVGITRNSAVLAQQAYLLTERIALHTVYIVQVKFDNN